MTSPLPLGDNVTKEDFDEVTLVKTTLTPDSSTEVANPVDTDTSSGIDSASETGARLLRQKSILKSGWTKLASKFWKIKRKLKELRRKWGRMGSARAIRDTVPAETGEKDLFFGLDAVTRARLMAVPRKTVLTHRGFYLQELNALRSTYASVDCFSVAKPAQNESSQESLVSCPAAKGKPAAPLENGRNVPAAVVVPVQVRTDQLRLALSRYALERPDALIKRKPRKAVRFILETIPEKPENSDDELLVAESGKPEKAALKSARSAAILHTVSRAIMARQGPMVIPGRLEHFLSVRSLGKCMVLAKLGVFPSPAPRAPLLALGTQRDFAPIGLVRACIASVVRSYFAALTARHVAEAQKAIEAPEVVAEAVAEDSAEEYETAEEAVTPKPETPISAEIVEVQAEVEAPAPAEVEVAVVQPLLEPVTTATTSQPARVPLARVMRRWAAENVCTPSRKAWCDYESDDEFTDEEEFLKGTKPDSDTPVSAPAASQPRTPKKRTRTRTSAQRTAAKAKKQALAETEQQASPATTVTTIATTATTTAAAAANGTANTAPEAPRLSLRERRNKRRNKSRSKQ